MTVPCYRWVLSRNMLSPASSMGNLNTSTQMGPLPCPALLPQASLWVNFNLWESKGNDVEKEGREKEGMLTISVPGRLHLIPRHPHPLHSCSNLTPYCISVLTHLALPLVCEGCDHPRLHHNSRTQGRPGTNRNLVSCVVELWV